MPSQPARLVFLGCCLFGALGLGVEMAAPRPAWAQDRRGPFTAEPRSVRSRDVDQQHIRLDLKVDLESQTFRGQATQRWASSSR